MDVMLDGEILMGVRGVKYFRGCGVVFLVHIERIKLTARWLNTLATGLIAAGVFAPAIAVLYGLSSLSFGSLFVAVVLASCLGLGVTIHLVALMLLGRMHQ
jgi:hypothetical protein